MDLRHLTTFRTIATLGSFSQAAELMGYAQSTVSEHIRMLESELQTRLFVRAGSKQVSLTSAGKALLSYAQKMSNLEDEIKSEINQPDQPLGTLSIRIPETVSIHFLPPVLTRFHQRFPKINLNFMNCLYFDLPDELKAGKIDLGFLISDSYQTEHLVTEVLRPIPLVMVTGPTHPLAAEPAIALSLLKPEPLLVPDNDCSYTHMLEHVLTEQKIRLSQVWRINSLAAIKEALKHGNGVSVLPEISVQGEVAHGELVILPWQDQNRISASLLMMWQKNKWLPPALQSFMEIIREELTQK